MVRITDELLKSLREDSLGPVRRGRRPLYGRVRPPLRPGLHRDR